MAPSNNSTQSPQLVGSQDPDLLCRSDWISVLTFYLVNYFAHCATVKPYPAEPTLEFTAAVILALFFPSSGVIRALDSISRHTRFSPKDEIQRAAQAGALCMVIRSNDWEPQVGDQIVGSKVSQGDEISDNKVMLRYPPWYYEPRRTSLPKGSIAERACKVHGVYSLPPGYELIYVPSDAKLSKNSSAKNISIEVASTYSFVKSFVAVFQTMYAAITLYRARGNQVHLFGYASFGLTVTPYLVMSLLNLIGQLVTPDYPCLYLIHSPEMDEAQCRGGYFDGVIGSLVQPVKSTDMEEWIVEAASATVSTVKAFDQPQHPPAGDVSQTEDVELGDVSNKNRQFILRERTPGKDPTRLISLNLPTSFRVESSQKVFGYEIIIPRCSPYERTHTTAITENAGNHSYSDEPRRNSNSLLMFWIPLAVGLVSLTVNGIFSHFEKGSSTKAQRAWTMSWLLLGMVFGGFFSEWAGFEITHLNPHIRQGEYYYAVCHCLGSCLPLAIIFAPPIGGLVVVGQMISQYGSCERI